MRWRLCTARTQPNDTGHFPGAAPVAPLLWAHAYRLYWPSPNLLTRCLRLPLPIVQLHTRITAGFDYKGQAARRFSLPAKHPLSPPVAPAVAHASPIPPIFRLEAARKLASTNGAAGADTPDDRGRGTGKVGVLPREMMLMSVMR